MEVFMETMGLVFVGGIDTLFYVKTKEGSFALGSRNIGFDCYYFPLALEIIKLLKKGCTDPDKIVKELNDFLGVCDKDWTEDDANVVIDMVSETVLAPDIILMNADELKETWGMTIVKNKDGMFAKWEGDDELEPVINADEQIDKIYPFSSKETRTFDELEMIVEFIEWCEKQSSTEFEYHGSLFYHFEQA